MTYMEQLGVNAKEAEKSLAAINADQKNEALWALADSLVEKSDEIIAENLKDIEKARENGKTEAFIDRLSLNEKRVTDISEGLEQVALLPDPVGEVIGGSERPNGLNIIKKRVPLGVVGIIYESRPNVTVDAAALCLKSGNACILRGGSDAINTNKIITAVIRDTLAANGISANAVQLVEDTSREVAAEMMTLRRYIDVLVPRGGGNLINTVIENAKIPVIETGEGNCHVYVDESADIDMAVAITDNSKTHRPSVCNAIESVLVHKSVAERFYKLLHEKWGDKVKIYGDEVTAQHIAVERAATDEDYRKEFNDYIIAAKTVDNIDEAIEHINRFGTKHSECIVTKDLGNAAKFQNEIDAAAVYVNASTRFTDGFEFGLGAEIGITTQKLHARGPMGLRELTTYKYLINGNGQIRK